MASFERAADVYETYSRSRTDMAYPYRECHCRPGHHLGRGGCGPSAGGYEGLSYVSLTSIVAFSLASGKGMDVRADCSGVSTPSSRTQIRARL